MAKKIANKLTKKKKSTVKALVKPLNMKMRGLPIVQMKYSGSFTRDQIVKIVNKQSDNLKKLGFEGIIMSTLFLGNGQWRSAPFTEIGEDIPVYRELEYDQIGDDDDDDDTKYSEFRLYIGKTAEKKGGCSANDGTNDCLFKCLSEIIPTSENPWKNGGEFKKFLGVQRYDKVDYELIPKVESKLKKYQINVFGDYIYSSTIRSKFMINLNLINGHYTLENEIPKVKGIALEEKIPLIYRNDKESDQIETYDGKKIRLITSEKFRSIRQKPVSSAYILIPYQPLALSPSNDLPEKSLEDSWKDFCSDADILKKETKGEINLYKTGLDNKTAIELFYRMSKGLEVEHIKQDEAMWLEKTKCASLIWAEPYEGEGYKYDVVSQYPSIMASNHMLFPTKRGEFMKKTQKEFEELKCFIYGIYRCVITPSEDKTTNRQFRFNKNNYYTQIDLNVAKSLGLKIELIQDNQPNILHYPRDSLIEGHRLFGKYIELLFGLKQKKVPRSKILLNILWGTLCQVNTIKSIISEDGECFELRENTEVRSIQPLTKNKTMISYAKNENFYETNYARMAPFLLAKGRSNMYHLLKDHIQNIRRVHTDGFISTIELDIKLGNNLGELKFEKYYEELDIFALHRIKFFGVFFFSFKFF